ncbi:MAG: DUF975 family protein [Firmicutes bacterium]|nr:DUF975 family protein [Bacillota bacterium]
MDNRIILEPISKIKEIARQSLTGKWKEMYLGMFIYFALISIVSMVLDHFFTVNDYVQMYDGSYMMIELTYASSFYELVVMGALTCGMAMFMLAFFRAKKTDYGLLFEGFSMFGKCFWLYLLYAIKIALWSLLFVIPGVIAAFRYSQCFYLRVDHPEWTAGMCLKESSRLMMGNKGKYFGLQLSFIGWYMLALLPTVLLSMFQTSDLMLMVVAIVGSIPVLIVDLYMQVTNTAFYELLNGNLVVVRENTDEFFY